MISKVTGILSFRGTDHVVIDVNGIGYEVFLADSTLAKIPNSTKKISVYTELIVREDLLQLVGFATRHEREWYRLLTGVQGVGAKAALKILGTLQINMLARSILTGDVNSIKASPGIGPKIAQRITSELKDKASVLMAEASENNRNELVSDITSVLVDENVPKGFDDFDEEEIAFGQSSQTEPSQLQSEALSALTNLGYASYDAALAVTSVIRDNDNVLTVQELIKLALQNLSPKG